MNARYATQALRVIEIMREWNRPLSCATIGNELWGRMYRMPQHWCRPAGALLHRLERDGFVFNSRRGWVPTGKKVQP